jgi:prepilin-type processing-associated H-X9-DG protein
MYAGDNNDRLAGNSDKSYLFPNAPGGTPSWVYGWLDWTMSTANTNLHYLTSDAAASLGPYVAKQVGVYRCPADNYLSDVQRALGWPNRSRSIAMDGAVGDGAVAVPGTHQKCPSISFSTYWAIKMSDLVAPGPSMSWVFTDEHPDHIDDGILYINPACTNGNGQFTELPGSLHAGACGISFADGHAEIHKWVDPTTVTPVIRSPGSPVDVSNNKDLAWLAQRTPRAQ